MRMPRIPLLVVVIASLALVGPVAGGGAGHVSDGATKPSADVDTSYALVQLRGEPLSTYVKTKPAHGKKIDFGNTSVKSYRAQLSAFRNDFKQWLQANAPKAKVVRSWDLSLNAVSVQLNGTTLAKLATAPQVAHVEYSGLYHPTIDDPDLSLINAQAAWSAVGGVANAGAGVKIAIVDSGIDVTHPCFDDAGYAPQAQLGDTTFTNNKVIVAKVFNMKTPSRHYTPEAINAHGTHVAGTAACNYQTPVTIQGVDIPYDMSGVAPAALLGNYNVFPDDVGNAHSEDIIDALEAAYTDGFDVANMSLGGRHQGISDLLTMAVDDLDQANMVIAVAAGNSGDGSDAGDHPVFPPGHLTIESPGSAARALTAGAFAVGHTIGNLFTIGGNSYLAVPGDFPLVTTTPLTAPTAILTDAPVNAFSGFSEVCGTLPAGSLTGMIAMIGRGTCDFSWKIRTAELAGAVGVIMVNRVPGDPIPMGQGASPDGVQPTIPAYMISLEGGIAIRTANPSLNGANGTIGTPEYVLTDSDYVQSGFSSQGPTDVDFRVKPDVMAPGENVISSIPESQCDHDLDDHCFAFFNGTSMATPHLAGSAAVVRGAHPDWTAEQVRSAIVNRAAMGDVISATGAVVTDANITGAGRVDLAAAVSSPVAIGPVSTSFGAVPAGSGQSLTTWVTITNLTAGTHTWSLAITDVQGAGVSFSLGSSSVTLAAGASTTVSVTLTSVKGAAAGDHQALLRVNGATATLAHSVVYALVK